MSCISAKDLMYPRVSLPAKTKGSDLVKKLTAPYPGLPVVNDKDEVIGIVSEYDVLGAIREGRTIHEFSAESLMSCGHAEHGVCAAPITVGPNTSIEDIADLMYARSVSILPVVENKKLVGLITRKSIINAMSEEGYWKEHEFKKRV
jgi:CBS domain-containing protein